MPRLPRLPFGKGDPYAVIKARRQAEQAEARRVCTDIVWGQAGDGAVGCCECTGCPKCASSPTCARTVWRAHTDFTKVGHVDEIVPRSQGGDPTNPDECRLICWHCHFSGPSFGHRTTAR